MVSPDNIDMSDQRVGEISSEGLLKGRKHFAQSVMVSDAVSKLGKTYLVSVQPGVKTNTVYDCENVLEQGLLLAIRRISNNDFVFQQEGAPAHRRLPVLQCAGVHWTRKLAAKQSRSKSRGLFGVETGEHCSRWCNVTKVQTLISWSKFWSTPALS